MAGSGSPLPALMSGTCRSSLSDSRAARTKPAVPAPTTQWRPCTGGRRRISAASRARSAQSRRGFELVLRSTARSAEPQLAVAAGDQPGDRAFDHRSVLAVDSLELWIAGALAVRPGDRVEPMQRQRAAVWLWCTVSAAGSFDTPSRSSPSGSGTLGWWWGEEGADLPARNADPRGAVLRPLPHGLRCRELLECLYVLKGETVRRRTRPYGDGPRRGWVERRTACGTRG
jgi:hypothetical protein